MTDTRCPYPQCDFAGTEEAVDDHRAYTHRDEPQAGSNLTAAQVIARATGSVNATVINDHRDPVTGLIVVDSADTYTKPTTTIDFTSHDTLPVDDDLKHHLTFATMTDDDKAALITLLRDDYYACAADLLDARDDEWNAYGDDRGDYQKGSADVMTWLHGTFAYALWHSELDETMVSELNAMLNCADEDHCLHQWAIDGPKLNLVRLCPGWDACPILNAPPAPITYKILRFFRDDRPTLTIARGLTLDQAQAHCRSAMTRGDGWFDGHEQERMI